MLLPDQFMEVAESSGLIVPIGDWVLRQACIRAAEWHGAGYPLAMAVNLSPVQFLHDHLLQSVDAALATSGLAPEFLDIELTEGAIVRGSDKAIDTVRALRARGIRVTVDDFGTGYSSLATLRRIPLNKIKIDSSFIADISHKPDDAEMIAAIIALARSLKLRVIAEGVETEEQLRFLRQHGCDEFQGNYAGRPQADPDLTRQHH
jgi:EAL domain-containing protein (putative c-di-GMP-specific phosphodiesterase class I)